MIMITKLKSLLTSLMSNYTNTTPKKRSIYNKFLSLIFRNLRSYYTIPGVDSSFSSIETDIFKKNKSKFQIINDSYIGKKIRDNIPSVAGYIPYLKNQTSIYIYHFFSINYGLRKTLIGQLSLIGENDDIVKSIVLSIPSRFNGLLDLKKIFQDLSGVSCILEIYHPRLGNNHAGHQGHFRFWGIYGRHTSTVHSMPLFPFIVKDSIPTFAERRFYPKINSTNSNYFINYSLKEKTLKYKVDGDLSSILKLKSGFTLQMTKLNTQDKTDQPSGVWHHSTFTRNVFLNENEKKSFQAISFPSIEDIDALLFFGEYVTTNTEIEFTLIDRELNANLETKKITVDTSKQLKVSDIFKKFQLKGSKIILSPVINNGKNIYRNGYTNVQYIIKDNLCDGVHAHPITPSFKSQGLKFMHYKIDENFSSFVSVWGAINHSIDYRLRIFDSKNNFEKCYHLKIKKNSAIEQINIEDLGIPKGEGIVQLECDSYNPAATSFIYSKGNNSSFLSVCHMTGG